jgi:S1-C subfamily serine protease
MAGLSFPEHGVTVVEVAENSPASAAGLRVGMILATVNRTAINSPKDFYTAVEKLAGPVSVRIADERTQPERIIEAGK